MFERLIERSPFYMDGELTRNDTITISVKNERFTVNLFFQFRNVNKKCPSFSKQDFRVKNPPSPVLVYFCQEQLRVTKILKIFTFYLIHYCSLTLGHRFPWFTFFFDCLVSNYFFIFLVVFYLPFKTITITTTKK